MTSRPVICTVIPRWGEALTASSAGRVLHGEQVRDKLADQDVPADQFRGDLLGPEQHADGLVGLTALGVCAGHLDEQAGLPFGRQAAGVHRGGGTQRAARVAQVDGDSDLLQSHVGRAELGVVVVAALAEPSGDLFGALKLVVGGIGVVDPGGDDRALQGQPTPQRHGLQVTAVSQRPQRLRCGPGRLLGLVVMAS